MPNPWILLALVLAWGASNFGTYQYGRHVEGSARDSKMLDAVNQAVEHANELAGQDYAAAASAWGASEARHKANAIVASQVQHSIETKIEYRNCALDDGDLAMLNAALEGKP